MKRQRRASSAGVLCAALLAVLACEPTAPDLREWKTSDHENTSVPNRAQVATGDAAAAQAAPQPGLDDVTVITWTRNCAKCHGRVGRGDGPQGPMVRAQSLADPAWQRSVTDERIAESIRRGKNAMPAFDLPEKTVTGLVKLIRLFNLARLAPRDAGATPNDGGANDSSTDSQADSTPAD